MKVRAYTLNVHAGHAPCWMRDESKNCEVLSLANCKPKIRNADTVGEWIAGVTPTRMGLRLAYLMKVGERISRFHYWERYKGSRFDSIYEPKSEGGWNRLNNPWHRDRESFDRDLSSDWVLLSTDFWVFANSYSERNVEPNGLPLPNDYSVLACGGMRGAGQYKELPDSFLPWIQRQIPLRLEGFQILRDFGENGCGCYEDEADLPVKCL